MADGIYTYTANRRTPRPRSKRLRECGGGSYVSSTGSVTYVSGGSFSAAEEAREAAANANSAATNANAAAQSAETAAQTATDAATNATAAAQSANEAATSASAAAQTATTSAVEANTAASSASDAAEQALAAAQSANSAATNANAAAQAAYEAIEALGDIANIVPITDDEIDELLKGFRFIDSFTVTAEGEYPLTLEAQNGADGADITGSVDISEIADDDIRKAFKNG